MPTINAENLLLTLQKKISRNPSDTDILNLSVALKQLRGATILSVGTISELPTANQSNLGKLYYVETERSIYQVTYLNSTYFWKLLAQQSLNTLLTAGWGGYGLGGDSAGNNTCCLNNNFWNYIPQRSRNSICDIAAGPSTLFVIDYSGTTFGAGLNNHAILGVGNCCTLSNCFRENASQIKFKQIASDDSSTNGISVDGKLLTWGRNYYSNLGQAGLGNGTCLMVPTQVTNSENFSWLKTQKSSNWTSAAIREDGTLWTWGYNSSWAMGIGCCNNLCFSSPVQVAGGGTDWCDVAGSYVGFHALKTNGCIWSWGANSFGQIGDGTTISRCSPVTMLGNDGTWCRLMYGSGESSYTSAFIKSDGTLWTVGYVNYGLLGNGSCTGCGASSPIQTAAGGTNWCYVAMENRNAVAIKTDGTLWTWGCNDNGQLALGVLSPTCCFSAVPTRVCPSTKSNYWIATVGRQNLYALDRYNACTI